MMLKTLRCVLLSGLFAVQLTGCTSLIRIEATQPPVVSVAHNQWKVLVVNRFDASLLPYKNDRKAEVFRDGAYQAAGGAMGAVYNDSTFVLVNQDSAVNYPAPPTAPQLTPEEIKQLYATYPTHLVLSLDNFDASMDKEVDSFQDEDGTRSKTAYYTLQVKTVWTLYDSTGTVLDRATIRQEEFYDQRAVISGLLAIGPAMAKAGPAVNRLAVETGYSYWDRLYPQKTLLVRELHTIAPFARPIQHLYAQEWQQAIQLLLPLALDNGFKHSGKAAHNLAVAYEAVGNYEQATRWALEAISKGDKLASKLVEEWSITGSNKNLKVVETAIQE